MIIGRLHVRGHTTWRCTMCNHDHPRGTSHIQAWAQHMEDVKQDEESTIGRLWRPSDEVL